MKAILAVVMRKGAFGAQHERNALNRDTERVEYKAKFTARFKAVERIARSSFSRQLISFDQASPEDMLGVLPKRPNNYGAKAVCGRTQRDRRNAYISRTE